MIIKSIRSNSIALALFALATALVLSSVDNLTRDKIDYAERLAAQRALLEIVPPERHNNDLLLDTQPVPEAFWSILGLIKGGNIHIARYNGEPIAAIPIAAIVPSVTADGYSGDIAMIIGVNNEGTIAGVRVVQHKETPGLGDKIDLKKNDWILAFNGKSLSNMARSQWAVKKDGGQFDQFTGATITPRAVINQIVATLDYFNQDSDRLFNQPQKKATNSTGQVEQ